MSIHPINSSSNESKQSFHSTPLKIVQSLGWVALAILALPTIIGSYFAWKKLVAIWDKNERSDTGATNLVASNVLGKETIESLLEKWVKKAPKGEEGRRIEARCRILQFLEGQKTTLDLSGLNLSTMPHIFEDRRFSRLEKLNLIGNQLTSCPMLGSVNHIKFNKSPLEQSEQTEEKSEQRAAVVKHLQEECFVVQKESFDEEDFDILPEICNQKPPSEAQAEELETLYLQAIHQFRALGHLLRFSSTAAYFDYLKRTEKGFPFDFNIDLLHKVNPSFDDFLKKIKESAEKAPKDNVSLIFVPFLLAKSFVHEQHIVVAVINVAKQQIEYFDPKGNQWYSILGNLVDRNLGGYNISIQEFLKRLSLSVFPDKKEPPITRNINGPQPFSNGTDCGAHILSFVESMLHNPDVTQDGNYFKTALPSNGAQIRQEMANTLENFLKSLRSGKEKAEEQSN